MIIIAIYAELKATLLTIEKYNLLIKENIKSMMITIKCYKNG